MIIWSFPTGLLTLEWGPQNSAGGSAVRDYREATVCEEGWGCFGQTAGASGGGSLSTASLKKKKKKNPEVFRGWGGSVCPRQTGSSRIPWREKQQCRDVSAVLNFHRQKIREWSANEGVSGGKRRNGKTCLVRMEISCSFFFFFNFAESKEMHPRITTRKRLHHPNTNLIIVKYGIYFFFNLNQWAVTCFNFQMGGCHSHVCTRSKIEGIKNNEYN